MESIKFNIEMFDPRKEELQKLVLDSSKVTADPKDITKEELALVATTRKSIMKYRTSIKAKGLEARGVANQYNKDVLAYEKELLGVIAPEEDRLKEIESKVKEYRIKQVRKEKLPEVKERLATLQDGVVVSDDELLAMDTTEIDAHYNERLTAKNEVERVKLEEDRKALAQEKEIEDARAEERANADKRAAQERADRIKKEEEEAQRAKEEAKRKEQEEKDRIKKEEDDRIAAKKAQDEDAKYQKFLADNKYTEKTDKIIDGAIYRLVAKYEA